MRPTVAEQLGGVLRWLDAVAADPGLSAASVERLADATRVLRRLETSAPARMPFLFADNDATEALLGDLGVTAAPAGTARSEDEAQARNLALRAAAGGSHCGHRCAAGLARRRRSPAAHRRAPRGAASKPTRSLNRNPVPHGGPTT